MKNPDRLYELLPVVHRMRDAEQGYSLQALLRVIAEQVKIVEDDIQQLYENWFIETCEEWVMPYIGDLVGYELLNDAGEPGDVTTPREQQRERILIPRRDVANTIHARRRKGTLALLEELASDVAGWPARAVEFYKLLGWTQNIHSPYLNRPMYHAVRIGDTVSSIAIRYQVAVDDLRWLNPHIKEDTALTAGTRLLVGWRRARGQTVDLRDGDTLALINGPFDRIAHTVEVRRIDSQHTQGRYNIPSVGLFVWRLKPYSVSWVGAVDTEQASQSGGTPAYCVEEEGPHCYTFSVLGNDTPLFNRPQPESEPTHIAGELNLPTPIRRRAFEKRVLMDGRLDHTEASETYYGPTKSLVIWAPDWPKKGAQQPLPANIVIPADLRDWYYQPRKKNHVAVDPETGRIVFPANKLPKKGVTVYYQYGFSTDIGGGEYDRPISQPAGAKLYRVGAGGDFETITDALNKWASDKQAPAASASSTASSATDVSEELAPASAVIEITDSGAYTEKLNLTLDARESLQIRAANRARPVIRLLDYLANQPDALAVRGGNGSRFTMDGLLVTGRGLVVQGPDTDSETVPSAKPGDLCDVTIRHCTLVPGWGLHCDCEPRRPAEPSVELLNTTAQIKIEHSIFGSIEVTADATSTDPVIIKVSDSIWDATSVERQALRGPDGEIAYALLTVARTTVLGEIATHAIALAENCIFTGCVCVARRQIGCVRFCYVPPESRTPRRYECQPDLVSKAVNDKLARNEISPAERDAEVASEQSRVEPDFTSTRYGTPTYCQLADTCAEEITRGADDESEMGGFHDLYQPQRDANLRTRLDEYTPAGMDAGIIYAS